MERIIQRNGKWYKILIRFINLNLYTVTTFEITEDGKTHEYTERKEFDGYLKAKNYMEGLC